MAATCPGHCRRAVLQGSVRLPAVGDAPARWRWRTSFAAAYPPHFCRRLAGLLWDAAPPGARRQPGECRVEQFWEERLAACIEQRVEQFVSAGALPTSATLGWELADGYWDGQPLKWELGALVDREGPGSRQPAGRRAATPASR